MTTLKLGVLVGENNWSFFRDIYTDLSSYYQTETHYNRNFRLPLLQGRVNQWAYRNSIRTLLTRNDVCFFEWASDLLMAASHLPKRSAIVTRMHSFELTEWAPKIQWETVDRIILLSEAMRQMFVTGYPSQASKAVIIANGVDLTRFRPPQRRTFGFNLGMLCAIVPIKRVYETVLMHYNLCQAGYPAHLHIGGSPAGDLRYAAAVRRLVEQLGLQERVTFHGQVTDTARWLQQIDIFISNSFWEGQQVALLEAMACGCYCLAHRWYGVDEVLPQNNLYVTENELIQRILEFAGCSPNEQQVRQDALVTIAHERFDLEMTKTNIRKLIQETEASVH